MKRIAMLYILGWVGCGGGSETPVQKCDDLLSDVCDRGVQCVPQETGTHDNCVQQLQQVLACGTAKMVSASYDRCIQEIKGNACWILFPTDPQTGMTSLALPADCNGAIQMFEPAQPLPGSPLGAVSRLSTVTD